MKQKFRLFSLGAITLLSTFALPSPALAAQTHPAGTLISNNKTVWQINDSGTGRLGFESAEKFFSNRLSFDSVVQANAADFALPEVGNAPWGDGVLLADHAIVYQISGGQKHGFTSADVYLGQGFNFSVPIRQGNLSSLSEGVAINQATARHLNGTLVKAANNTVSLQTSEGLKAFPSAASFYSYGGNFNEVVNQNTNDGSVAGILSYRTGTLVNDRGAVWVIKQNTKLGFPNAACFINFGFNFSAAFSGDTSSLIVAGSICGDPATPAAGAIDSYSSTTLGGFSAEIASFNLASGKVRVITDTAADRDCTNNCPVASLGAYMSANGAQYGMNGTYFCPTSYAECAGKTNTFFWKVLDTKAGLMVNSTNGLGEEDPFITFDSLGQAKYYHRWIDYKNSGFSASAGINAASLIENKTISINYAKLDDKQKNTKSTQGALALKDNTLYLIHVFNATVPEATTALQTLGVDNAILLDGGGSTAMIYEGAYKSGPGRNIPNAVLVQVIP